MKLDDDYDNDDLSQRNETNEQTTTPRSSTKAGVKIRKENRGNREREKEQLK